MECNIIWGSTKFNLRTSLLFNIFICDMFYFLEDYDIANYADDSTPYNAENNVQSVVNNLEHSSSILFKWFNNNYMKVNTGKSHLLVSGNVRAKAKIDNNYIGSEKEQVLLGITIDSNLTFENHINICKKAGQKLNALARVAPYINMQKRRIITKSFVTSQFGYCPLIRMFHSGRLRITYQDHISTFQELVNKDNSVSVHHRNLQALATEMFKIHGDLSPDILREIFVPKIGLYNLCNHGTESLSFLGQKIWDLMPLELKQLESLEVFKLKIKKWISFECSCRLCRT